MEQQLGKFRCSTAAPALLNCFQSAADENLMKEAAPEETEAAQMAETSEKVMVLVGSASNTESAAFVRSSHLLQHALSVAQSASSGRGLRGGDAAAETATA